MDWFWNFIEAGKAMTPHGYCLLWYPGLVWTHVISDAVIALAYFSIPIALITFIKKRPDIQYSWIVWLFAAFILACGMTHIMSIWTLWHADYGWEAVLKAVTAVVSVGTAIVMWPLIPKGLKIPSPKSLEAKNIELEQALESLRHEMAERKRAEGALRQVQKMEAVGQLTGGIAHDFNNLLQNITGSLSLISENPESINVPKWAKLGLGASARGKKIASQLLAFSREQKIEMKSLSVNSVINGMVDLLRSASTSATIQYELNDNELVKCDSTQLEMSIMNLAINARDAMPDGGLMTIATKCVEIINNEELADGRYVRISVSDMGTGMSPQVREKAFDPFFTTKEVGKGSGLGLSMIYGIAKQSGGTVTIDTEIGKGTTVSIFLPVSSPDKSSVTPSFTPTKSPRLKILVVDDDNDVRSITVSMLEVLDHEVSEASSGREALAAIKNKVFDMVMLDFAMPELNGAQVAEEMLHAGVTSPIIFVSGYADSLMLTKAVGSDAQILAKPFDLSDLEAAISLRICE